MAVDRDGSPALDRLQSWMQMVITHPGGITSGVRSRDAQELVQIGFSRLEAVVTPSSTLTAAESLAIYSRSYHARHLQSLQSVFPALLHALGEDLFDCFAVDYLQHHPSRSYTLDQLADAFPHHLERTRPDAGLPPEERESWPDFIVDLATLELAVRQVFDGPGLEGDALEARDEMLTLPADLLLDTHPMPAPSFRLFSFRLPVHIYLLDVREERQPALPPPGRSFVAVARRNYRVTIHDLSPAQYAFLQRLDGRRSVRLAYDEVIRAGNLPPAPAVPIADWLRVWIRNDFFECRSADGCRNR